MEILMRFLLLLSGYAFGLIQTGYFYGRITGNDLKKEGSGNTGATNALRTRGLKVAFIIFLFDALKAFVPCFIVQVIFKDSGPLLWVYLAYTAIGVILGNDFPFYLKFDGGKGVAATAGYAYAWNGLSALILTVVFFGIAFLTGYVSLASIISSFGLAVAGVVFAALFLGGPSNLYFWEFSLIFVIQFLLIVYRHRKNVKRLLAGTENRFGHKKKAKQEEPENGKESESREENGSKEEPKSAEEPEK